MLYAFGSNGSGQLGLGHCEDVSVPSKVSLPLPAISDIPAKIAAGGNHTLLLLETGEIYASGSNADGRCGTTPSEKQHKTFQQGSVQLPENPKILNFRFCAATWESSTFVDEEGRLYTSGTGNRGQLGQGPNTTESVTPSMIAKFPPIGVHVTDLAASMGHTVAILSDGSVYGWGIGRKGQLGEPAVDCWSPRKIEHVPFRAIRVACGKDFTYLVGDSQDGHHLVLGSDKWQVRSASPQHVCGWKDVAASWSSIYVLLKSGNLLAWGRNDHEQLPSQNKALADNIAAGSEHALVLHGAENICRAYGWGEHGNCGNLGGGSDAPSGGNPVLADAKIMQVGAGCATSWIFTHT